MWCYISGEAAGEIWYWSLFGVKGVKEYILGQVVTWNECTSSDWLSRLLCRVFEFVSRCSQVWHLPALELLKFAALWSHLSCFLLRFTLFAGVWTVAFRSARRTLAARSGTWSPNGTTWCSRCARRPIALFCFLLCGQLGFESAVTTQNDEFQS